MRKLATVKTLAIVLVAAIPWATARAATTPGVVSDLVRACAPVIRKQVKGYRIGSLPAYETLGPQERRRFDLESVHSISSEIVFLAQANLPEVREKLQQYEARVNAPKKSDWTERNPFWECIAHRRLAQLSSGGQGLPVVDHGLSGPVVK